MTSNSDLKQILKDRKKTIDTIRRRRATGGSNSGEEDNEEAAAEEAEKEGIHKNSDQENIPPGSPVICSSNTADKLENLPNPCLLEPMAFEATAGENVVFENVDVEMECEISE